MKKKKLTRMKATIKPTTVIPSNLLIILHTMDPAFLPVALMLTAPTETVAPTLLPLVG